MRNAHTMHYAVTLYLLAAQLIFGQLVCLFFLSLHLRLKPYRDPSCDKMQTIVLVQLLVTYRWAPPRLRAA